MVDASLTQEDIFNITFADLGDIKEVEISHDNSGIAPGWHCEQVRGWRDQTRTAEL